MSHRKAVLLMIVVTLLWSSAGVVTRQLEEARSFEVTFWRSGFNTLFLAAILAFQRGTALLSQLRSAPRAVWVSGLAWSVMFTAFMVALTLTSIANVLVTMALGPLLTALFSRVFLHHRLPLRTWVAILVGSAGIAWMFGHEFRGGEGMLGILVALGVPIAAATNWTVLQHAAGQDDAEPDEPAPANDMPLAVLIGAAISALLALPLAWPTHAGAHDLTLLAGLGLFQLAVPCLLVVQVTRVLAGPEVALLGLLEVIFGVLWAWLLAGENPSSATIVGGALVLAALVGNELLAWRTTSRIDGATKA
ncbi:DMT family transporter [Paucibacter sp. R3-3]|uniref:DMT family transporter n=1 Tax=Roseateles agri TaxID=3098619 RepID=A0ABU5DKU5_9BURK|nr:DMT family transporter [Paucibacter sp. R3-3]MDY0746310.1 DMT family transporter [Paucibacter sp. R3-3]